MSRSVNRITLVGNVGGDPEIRHTHGGRKLCQFQVVTSRRWTKADGTNEEKTEWHRCVAFNTDRGRQMADVVEKFAKRGIRVYIEGRVEYRTYEDREGLERWVTEIILQEFLALDPKEAETSPAA